VLPEGRDDINHLARVVESCPTGALHYERHDGGDPEAVLERNTVDVAASGPLYVRGDVTVEDDAGEVLLTDTRLALCRCGASENRPLCDGSHGDAGFDAPGEVPVGAESGTDTAWTGGGLTVVPTPDGPLILRGEYELRGQADGSASDETDGAMCRCGGSGSKPFCDGSHTEVGFESD
jgi:CDGSH-type Zn-finger protein